MNANERRKEIVASIHDNYSNALLVSDEQNTLGIQSVGFNHINLKLGGAYSSVIIDCTNGFQANVLYACAGLVLKGGLLVLLTPDMSDWSRYYAQHRGIKFSFKDAHQHSYFAQMLKDAFEQSACLAWCSDNAYSFPILNTTTPSKSKTSRQTTQNKQSRIVLSAEQKKIAQHISISWKSQKSIHVISAERGRGKTTLLAQLALHALNASQEIFTRVIICAPSKAQSDTFFHYYGALGEHDDVHQTPVFVPADQFQHIRDKDLVLIDEMASIAPALLSQLCDRAQHVVLAGTLEGYEGSGRGMLLRWLPQYGETLNMHYLSIAFRWRTDDHLDQLIRSTLSPRLIETQLNDNDSLNLVEIDKGLLVGNANLYTQCFGLLMDAHYQSTANDIQRMLDGSDHRIWGYLNANQDVIGVICTIHEGGPKIFSNGQLRESISNGARRVQGHMSSQSLSQGFNLKAPLLLRFCRIHRIAVSPHYQRRGVGSAMLKALHQQQGLLEVDSFTTSFGINTNLDRFWHRNGYEIVKVGQRKDTSSGAITGHYLRTRPLDQAALIDLAQSGKVGIYVDLLYLKQFHPTLYELICERIKTIKSHKVLKEDAYQYCIHKVERFIQSQLSFAMVRSHIYYVAYYLNLSQLHELVIKQHTPHLSKHEKLSNIEKIKQCLIEALAKPIHS
jgi:tRNA(Met) cytidine acetyltransferase